MLLQNITRLAEHPLRQHGQLNADGPTTWGHKSERNANKYFGEAYMDKKLGVPKGYSSPYAWGQPLKGGGCVCVINGTTALSKAILAMGRYVSALITGSGGFSTTPNLSLIISLLANITASGTITKAALAGIVELVMNAYGTGEISVANLSAVINMAVNMAGIGSISKAELFGTLTLQANIYVNQSEATVRQLVDGIWDEAASAHNTAGTMGNKMNSAGSAGDPWAADPSTFTTGTAGDKLNKINNNAGIIPALL